MRLIFLVFTLFFAGFVQSAEMTVQKMSVETRQGPVAVQCYTDDTKSRPLVVLLHGSSGFNAFQKFYESYASALVAHGNRVCAVIYHNSEDSNYMKNADNNKRSRLYQRFDAWVEATEDVVSYLNQQAETKSGQVGLMGFSQGAILSLEVAAKMSSVKAVVEFYGALPPQATERIKQLPSLLVLHGDADQTIPVQEAYTVETFAKSHAPNCAIKIYHGAGHGFDGADRTDSMKMASEFFKAHL